MTELPDGICPLCSQIFPQEHLHAHIGSEHPRLRHTTILVIQAYHPGWLESHGACQPCWKSYRDAGRVLDLLKSGRAQNLGVYPDPAPPNAQNSAADQIRPQPSP